MKFIYSVLSVHHNFELYIVSEKTKISRCLLLVLSA